MKKRQKFIFYKRNCKYFRNPENKLTKPKKLFKNSNFFFYVYNIRRDFFFVSYILNFNFYFKKKF